MADGLTEAVTSVHDPEDGPYYYYLAYLAYLDAFLKPGQRRKGRKPHRVSGLCRWASQPTQLVSGWNEQVRDGLRPWSPEGLALSSRGFRPLTLSIQFVVSVAM